MGFNRFFLHPKNKLRFFIGDLAEKKKGYLVRDRYPFIVNNNVRGDELILPV